MECAKLTRRQKLALQSIASLEGRTMEASDLYDFLRRLGDPFEDNTWDFTSQADDYNEDSESDEVVTEILSNDYVELPNPYVCSDGSNAYFDGENLYEIWMEFLSSDSWEPDDDTEVTITDVIINLPDELWK